MELYEKKTKNKNRNKSKLSGERPWWNLYIKHPDVIIVKIEIFQTLQSLNKGVLWVLYGTLWIFLNLPLQVVAIPTMTLSQVNRILWNFSLISFARYVNYLNTCGEHYSSVISYNYDEAGLKHYKSMWVLFGKKVFGSLDRTIYMDYCFDNIKKCCFQFNLMSIKTPKTIV